MAKRKIRSNTVYTIIGNALILFVIGLLLYSLFIGQNLIRQLEDQFSFQLELRDSLDQSDIDGIIQLVQNIELVDPNSIVFQNRETLANELVNELDITTSQEIASAALFDAISFKLQSNKLNSADIIRLKRDLSKIPLVVGVNHIEDMSQGLFDNLERVRIVGFILSVILCIVLVVLIYNNTRLAIYAERFKIRKMQLIGAIPWFITKPFVSTAFGIGLGSGIVAIFGLFLFAFLAGGMIYDLEWRQSVPVILEIGAILCLISITISIVSSYVIVNRYLRMDTDDLYS